MTKEKADQPVSIRLPYGVADQLRAATGQPVSRLARFLLLRVLENQKAERALTEQRRKANDVVDSLTPAELQNLPNED